MIVEFIHTECKRANKSQKVFMGTPITEEYTINIMIKGLSGGWSHYDFALGSCHKEYTCAIWKPSH